jgi:hypothetical protein
VTDTEIKQKGNVGEKLTLKLLSASETQLEGLFHEV